MSSRRVTLRLLFLLPVGLAGLTSLPGGAAPRPVGAAVAVEPCTRYAAPWGKDGSRGTRARPFETAQRLADALRPGQTGCLRRGTYADDEGFVLNVQRGGRPNAPITIRSHPGERATLRGIVQIPNGSDHVTLARLRIEGTGDQNTVKIYSRDVVVEDSDISNAFRGKSCMMVGSASGYGEAVRPIVRRNRIHDCGSLEHDNKDHGIYISGAVGARIIGNVFWNIAAYAIHLYPNARGSRIAHNVVDGGPPSVRGGLLLAGDSDYASSANVVERNIVAYAQSSNVVSSWDDLIGRDNTVRRNCLWGGKDGNLDSSDGGFEAYANTIAPPAFVNRARHDYRLKRGSPCRDVVGYDPAARLRFR